MLTPQFTPHIIHHGTNALVSAEEHAWGHGEGKHHTFQFALVSPTGGKLQATDVSPL